MHLRGHPVDLFFAIDHALRIVNWQENLTEVKTDYRTSHGLGRGNVV